MAGLAVMLPHISPHSFMHIEDHGKSLIIRWRFEGKKYHKTLSKHNHPLGWKNAEIVMASIERDILSGHFDRTPYTQKGKVTKQNIDITASELFDRYAAYRIENFELFAVDRYRTITNNPVFP